MIRIAICDDEETMLYKLEKYVLQASREGNFECEIYKTIDPDLCIKEVSGNFYDVLILDIQMPGIDGFEIAKKINSNAKIIFVSHYDELVFDSFEYQPFYFVRKSCLEKLVDVILKYYSRYIRRYIILDTVDIGKIKLAFNDIVYLEAIKNYIQVHSQNDGRCLIRGPLKRIENDFPSEDFCKINKGTIVNVGYIKQLDESEVVLNLNNHILRLPITRGKLKDVRKQFFEKGLTNV